MTGQRQFARVLALGVWAFSGMILIGTLVWGGLRCDDACGGSGWRHSADAPQWTFLPLGGAAIFLAGLAFVIFIWRARPILALTTFVLSATAAFLGLEAFSPDWNEHIGRNPGATQLVAAVILGALGAVFLVFRTEI
jgi:hypothetical protein